jgi:hypothetical protein
MLPAGVNDGFQMVSVAGAACGWPPYVQFLNGALTRMRAVTGRHAKLWQYDVDGYPVATSGRRS